MHASGMNSILAVDILNKVQYLSARGAESCEKDRKLPAVETEISMHWCQFPSVTSHHGHPRGDIRDRDLRVLIISNRSVLQ